MEPVIIDYKMGNIGSIITMIKRIGYPVVFTSSKEKVEKADRLILPGVGAFDMAMHNLHQSGLLPLIEHKVLTDKIPILGICLGMQIMMETSQEGDMPGLGWLNGEVKRFEFSEKNRYKVPHMGWNHVRPANYTTLFMGLEEESRFYFVHSFYVDCKNKEDILGITHHGINFVSAIHRGNIFGVQFHPEKSHRYGMTLIKNFLEMS